MRRDRRRSTRLHDPAHERKEEHERDAVHDRSAKEPFGTHPIDELGEEEELEDAIAEAEKL